MAAGEGVKKKTKKRLSDTLRLEIREQGEKKVTISRQQKSQLIRS